MNVQTMIYAYLAVCISMIFFNCASIFAFRRRDQSLQRRSLRLEKDILNQFERMEAGEPVEERHKALLCKKLVYISKLRVFDETLTHLLEQDGEKVWRYLEEVASVFTCLAMENKYRGFMQRTYFAYVVQKYRIVQGKPAHTILEVMMEMLQEPGLYCRESALQAIYSTGDCGWVLRALHATDQNGHFHHSKLLMEGLMAFPGDQKQLADELWQNLETFSVSMQVTILDYIRFSGNCLHQELLGIMADSHRDDELRLSCIRYFGRHSCELAYPLLLDFVSCSKEEHWEYAAIAALSLASYPGQHTVEMLKKALSNPNWYIRFNAAKSLTAFQLSDLELSDIMEGDDRYAREILQYWLDVKKA